VNIAPAEIESVLLELAVVRDVAVVGVPDPEFGEVLAAHVDADPGAGLTAHDVRSYVRHRLAAYKVPHIVVFDEPLPRNSAGKLVRRRIRERYPI
jgi:Acyl-CoA synthetases (AMP-forming)/AMP-acid ligases II